jgi:hypothetical protein
MAEIHGATTIFSSSSTGAGDWYQLNPKLGNTTFQMLTTGSTAGKLITASVDIQASNNKVTPLATALGTISLSSAASPASDGLAINANWKYVRVNLTAVSTGKIEVMANGQVRS